MGINSLNIEGRYYIFEGEKVGEYEGKLSFSVGEKYKEYVVKKVRFHLGDVHITCSNDKEKYDVNITIKDAELYDYQFARPKKIDN